MLNRTERRGVSLVLWAVVLGWLVSTTTVTVLPYSAWRGATDPVVADDVRDVLPQGWAFFTRDPQEARVRVYVREAGEWKPVSYPAANSARWLFGLNRKARADAGELATVIGGLPESDWQDCGRGDHLACLRSLPPRPGQVANPIDPPRLCGTVGLVQQEPVPFAWKRAAETVDMPLRGLVTEVSCRH